MKFAIFACVAAVAVAAPHRDQSAEVIEFIPILRDDRVHEDDGRYNLDVETANGISMSQSGSPDGPDGAIVKAGQYSYTAPDGSLIEIKFVANENGFQPQGAHLPVAPEFPHPIPQFVLDQIAFAAEEDAARERAEAQASAPAPTRLYGQPHIYKDILTKSIISVVDVLSEQISKLRNPVILDLDPEQIRTKAFSSKIFQNERLDKHAKSPRKFRHGIIPKFRKTRMRCLVTA
ncbi:larval cuticle protein LCP-17-like [Penaeus indicus]|uniref:larval cuticle protein LCP-17-like n=1 Tax=Penaeus indicus TaxID=29960 RepID=UPI00300C2FDC